MSDHHDKRKDSMDINKIQKLKSFYSNVQLYIYAFPLRQFIIILIFTRQDAIKSGIIVEGKEELLFNVSVCLNKSFNTAKVLKKMLIETP